MRLFCISALSLIASAGAFAAPGVGVFVDFETPPSEGAVAAMKREVAYIMQPAGLTLSWQDLRNSTTGSAFPDLVVVRFKGACGGSPLPPAAIGASGATLASTAMSDGRILHFAEVRCDELRRYLSREIAPLRKSPREQLYGQALGRVLAHEMYHIFAGTEKHASGGVARACHSREELLQPIFGFGARETLVLQGYANRILAPKPSPAPVNAGG